MTEVFFKFENSSEMGQGFDLSCFLFGLNSELGQCSIFGVNLIQTHV